MTDELQQAKVFSDEIAEDLAVHIVETNDKTYTITKAIEELNELATVLGQYVNKKGTMKEPDVSEISDEIGDVMIRIGFLLHPATGIFDTEDHAENLVTARMREKMGKYFKFVKEDKYTGRI